MARLCTKRFNSSNSPRSRARQELTERGRPIAVIKPVKHEPSEEAALDAMADEGLIRAALSPAPTPALRWKPVGVKGKPVSHTVIEGREDRA